MDLVKIGSYIAEKRKKLGMTQKQLAEKLGKSDKSVSKWERGICLPDVSVYLELCEILGISLNEFLAGEDIEVSAVANASIKNEVGKWDVCLVGPQLVFAVDSIHQQLNIPVASIEPRAYAMADGAAAIEMAKKLLG